MSGIRSWETVTDEIKSALTDRTVRSEITLDVTAAPARLATHTAAVMADVARDDIEIGTGRLIFLYEPTLQEEWEGHIRCVAYVRSNLETELVTDPLLLEVGWSWVQDALNEREIPAIALSTTVSRSGSQSFGEISHREPEGYVEIRASWTVAGDNSVVPSIMAWCDLLAQASGLEPLPEGVSSINIAGRK